MSVPFGRAVDRFGRRLGISGYPTFNTPLFGPQHGSWSDNIPSQVTYQWPIWDGCPQDWNSQTSIYGVTKTFPVTFRLTNQFGMSLGSDNIDGSGFNFGFGYDQQSFSDDSGQSIDSVNSMVNVTDSHGVTELVPNGYGIQPILTQNFNRFGEYGPMPITPTGFFINFGQSVPPNFISDPREYTNPPPGLPTPWLLRKGVWRFTLTTVPPQLLSASLIIQPLRFGTFAINPTFQVNGIVFRGIYNIPNPISFDQRFDLRACAAWQPYIMFVLDTHGPGFPNYLASPWSLGIAGELVGAA